MDLGVRGDRSLLGAHVRLTRLLPTIAAFFLAVGLAAHAFDELNGRPLRTRIPSSTLIGVAAIALGGSIGLGIVGIGQVGWVLIPFLVVGPVLVLAYNFELFGGVLHNDLTFAAAWGAFPS